MNVFVLLVILLSSYSNNSAQNQKSTLIRNGLEASYNFDFVQAEKVFQNAITENPRHPAGYYFLSQIYLWKYMGGNDKGDRGVFLKYAEMAIDKSELLIEQKEDAEFYFYLGSAHQLKAVALMYEGEFFDSYGDINDAVDNLSECLELDPEFYDAYLGLGISNYTLSYVPSFYRFFINLFGLSSDKEKGFEQIKTAAEKGKLNLYEARFYQARLLTDYTAEFDSSLKIIEDLLSRFPNNIILLYQHSLSSILNLEFDKARISLNKIIEISNPDFMQTNSFAYLRIGDIEFTNNNYENAIYYYEKFLTETRSFEYSGYCYYQIALCHAFLDNDLLSKRNLILARNGNPEIPEDYFAARKSEYFFEKGYSGQYLSLITAENLIKMKDLISADSILTEILGAKIIEKEIEAKAFYLKSKIEIDRDNLKSVSSFAAKIELENLNIEKWIYPASKLLLAESYFKLNEKQKFQRYLKEASEYNKYEFAELIESKIENLKRRIENSEN